MEAAAAGRRDDQLSAAGPDQRVVRNGARRWPAGTTLIVNAAQAQEIAPQ